jgi:hypothetical protein
VPRRVRGQILNGLIRWAWHAAVQDARASGGIPSLGPKSAHRDVVDAQICYRPTISVNIPRKRR